MQKYLLRKSSYFVDIFILSKFLHQKVAVLSKQLPYRTTYSQDLRIEVEVETCLVEVSLLKSSYLEKNICCEEAIVLRKELLKKVAALKKWLLWKRNCCVKVVTLKKCEELASPKIKLSWKSRYIFKKGNHHLKKFFLN